jgi:hypothetical protein
LTPDVAVIAHDATIGEAAFTTRTVQDVSTPAKDHGSRAGDR